MACCAVGKGCDDPTCRLCTVIAKLPQPTDLRRDQRTTYAEPGKQPKAKKGARGK